MLFVCFKEHSGNFITGFYEIVIMSDADDSSEHDMFVTEFPKKGFGIVDYLQGRVHFSIMDQMKLMHKSGMSQDEIKKALLASITDIIDSFEPDSKSP